MTLLFAFLTFAFLVMLIIGLIKPSAVIFWSTHKTRGKALLIYGLGLIVCFVLLGVVSPTEDKQVSKEFYGEIVYQAEVSGDSSIARSLADMGIPHLTTIQIGKNSFQCTEEGGLTDGTFFKDTAKYKSWYLDPRSKTAIYGTCSDIDENVNDALRQLLPYNYKTDLEETGEEEVICGYTTKKYKVLKSAYIRDYATAWVWITKDLKFPLRRYDFQTQTKRMVSPLPLTLINEIGAILKVEVHETGVVVTYTATRLIEKDYGAFSIPEGYAIVSDTDN